MVQDLHHPLLPLLLAHLMNDWQVKSLNAKTLCLQADLVRNNQPPKVPWRGQGKATFHRTLPEITLPGLLTFSALLLPLHLPSVWAYFLTKSLTCESFSKGVLLRNPTKNHSWGHSTCQVALSNGTVLLGPLPLFAPSGLWVLAASYCH